MSIDRFNLNDYHIDSIRIHETPIFCNHCDFKENAYTLTNKRKQPHVEKGNGVYLLSKSDDSKNLIFCKFGCLSKEIDFQRSNIDDIFIKLKGYFPKFSLLYKGSENLSPTLAAFCCKIIKDLKNKPKNEITEYVRNNFINKYHSNKTDRFNPYAKLTIRSKEYTKRLTRIDLVNNSNNESIHEPSQVPGNNYEAVDEDVLNHDNISNLSQDLSDNLDFLNEILPRPEDLFNLELPNEGI